MPVISTALVTAAVVGVTVGTKVGIVAGILAATAVLAVGLVQRFVLAPGETGLDQSGTQQTLRTESAPAEWVFGQVRKGGILAYVLNSGGKKTKQHIFMRILVGHGECDALTDIFIGKDKLNFTTGNIPVETGHHNRQMVPPPGRAGSLLPDHQGKLHRPTRSNTKEYADGSNRDPDRFSCLSMFAADGRQGQHLTDWCRVTDVPTGQGRWTAAHTLTGISYVDFYYLQPKSNFWKQLPETNIVLKGLKFTWPTQDTPAWTDNPAAIAYWYLTERKGIPADAIDLPSFQQSIEICRAPVTYQYPDTWEPGDARVPAPNPAPGTQPPADAVPNGPFGQLYWRGRTWTRDGAGWRDIGPAPAYSQDADGYTTNPDSMYNTRTRPRYSFNGVIRSGDLWPNVRTELEQAMGGDIIFERGGVWYIRAGTDRVPSFVLTEDDVVEGSVETSPQSEEFFNRATAVLSQNRFGDYQKYTLDYTDEAALAEDGELKSKNFGSLASIADPLQGYRFLRTQFVQNRHSSLQTHPCLLYTSPSPRD